MPALLLLGAAAGTMVSERGQEVTAFAYQVRSAAPCDAESLCAVHVASIRGLCAGDYSAEQIDAWAGVKKPDIYRQAMAEGEQMFVAETQTADGEMTVIGLAGVHGSEVRAVYVHPAYVGLGVGSALLATIEAEARL